MNDIVEFLIYFIGGVGLRKDCKEIGCEVIWVCKIILLLKCEDVRRWKKKLGGWCNYLYGGSGFWDICVFMEIEWSNINNVKE